MRFVSIDPGLRHLGLAMFEGARLMKAVLVANPETTRRGAVAWVEMAAEVRRACASFQPHTLVIEEMQRDSRTVGAAIDDLLQVQGVGGAVASGLRAMTVDAVVGYTPSAWKGSVPKPVHNKRVLGKLTAAEELAIDFCAPHLQNNVTDAIGLGLFWLKKTKVRP